MQHATRLFARALAPLALVSLLPAAALAQGTVVLECSAVGIGGDNASFRGVRFEVNQSFTAVEIHVQGASAGVRDFDLELRRSMGYVDPIVHSVPVSANLAGTASTTPYPAIRVDFPAPVVVNGTEFFTLKVANLSGGTMYWEVAGIGNIPCPMAIVTDQNNVANPTVRTSACGLKVINDNGGVLGVNYCTALPNSTGAAAEISAAGSSVAATNDLTLVASGVPAGQFGIFLTSETQASTPLQSGILCVGGNIIRFQGPGQILQADMGGEFSLQIDTTALPAGVPTPIAPGDTWNFTAWFRDFDPASGNTANFTDGIEIAFS